MTFDPTPSRSLPCEIAAVGVPPIKCQGIKTKLVTWLASQIQWSGEGRWVEPFIGSGVVVFNLRPQRALLTDTNQHIIRVYQGIQSGDITRSRVREFLTQEGKILARTGSDHYYVVRSRFNEQHSPLDFLFLNRACFNGLMRFNRDGGFNVPFCRKPERFSTSYITKIANQVEWVAQQMRDRDWTFAVQDWQTTLTQTQPTDFVYLDPPYIGRHTDYYNQWTDADAEKLATIAHTLPCGFALSMWLENQYRRNHHLDESWSGLEQRVRSHFYHVGSKETFRGEMQEALMIKPGFVAIDSSK